MRKPIRGNVPMALTDEQIIKLRKIYEQIRQIKYSHAYAMLCLADTTKEERAFFAALGDINNGRSYEEEQAEVGRILQLIDDRTPWYEAQEEASDRIVPVYLTAEEKSIAKHYAAAKGITLPDACKEALFEKIEDEYDSAVAEEAYAEYIASGCKSTPADELWRELGLDEEQPNDETIAAILETERIARDPTARRYQDVEEALAALKAEVAEMTDDEKIDVVAARILKRFKPAFEKLAFKTNLTMEEIERNFEGVDLFSELMAGLEEALEYTKGNLKAHTRTLTIENEPQIRAGEAVDPFFSESNKEFLCRGVDALNAGNGVEHEIIDVQDDKKQAIIHLMDELKKGRKSGEEEGWLTVEDIEEQLRIVHCFKNEQTKVDLDIIEAKLVSEGLADIENDKTMDGDSVRARMAEKYGI